MDESEQGPREIMAGADASRLRIGLLELAALLLRYTLLPAVLVLDALEIFQGRSTPGVWLTLFGTLAFAIVFGRPRDSDVSRDALGLVVFLMALGLLTMAHFGPVMGVATLFSAAVVLAAIYFGLRGLVLSVLGLLLGGGWLVAMIRLGVLAPPAAHLRDPTLAATWIRTGVPFFLGFVGVGACIAYIVVGRRDAERAAGRARAREREERDRGELAREEWGRAQRMEAVARLTGGVGHDFNNALVVILGAAEMLRKRVPADSVEEQLALDLMEAARGAGEITRQLLTLGRRDVSSARSVSVRDAMASLRRALTRVLPAGIELHVDAEVDAHVWIDPAQLDQVLINLAMNARDAMPTGGRLELRARRDAPDAPGEGGWMRFEVEDHGEGMSSATMSRIFEPFFTTKERGRGTGLGLATVREIVESAGGRVECESSLGEGSCFTLILPLTERRSGLRGEAEGSSRTSSSRILLVEDRDDVRSLTAQALREAGHVIIEAVDGKSAASAIRDHGPFDLLCTDAVMPDTNTNELISLFERECPGSPVLVCSGHITEDLLRRGIEAGRYAHLAKPYTPAELLTSIDGLSRTGPSTTT